MKTYVAVTAFAVFLGLASLAQAAELLSPPLPTNSRPSIAIAGTCRILNTGTSPVAVQVSLFSNNAHTGYDIDTCNQAPLAGGHTCMVLVDHLPDESYAACKVTASNVSKLRGTIELWEDDKQFVVRVAEELQVRPCPSHPYGQTTMLPTKGGFYENSHRDSAFAAALALGGVSQAAQIASPTILGTGEQDMAHCIVLNGGTSPLAVTLKIINEFGGTEWTDNCFGPLGAGQFCRSGSPLTTRGPMPVSLRPGRPRTCAARWSSRRKCRDPSGANTSTARSAPRRCGRRCPAGDVTVPAVLAHGRRGPTNGGRGGVDNN